MGVGRGNGDTLECYAHKSRNTEPRILAETRTEGFLELLEEARLCRHLT